MRLGDVLELVGLAVLSMAAYLAAGVPGGLSVAAIGLVYLGQCYGHIELPSSFTKMLGGTRYRRIVDLESQIGEWPSVRPARGSSKDALRAQAKWLDESIRFRRRLGLDPTALASELQTVRSRIDTAVPR